MKRICLLSVLLLCGLPMAAQRPPGDDRGDAARLFTTYSAGTFAELDRALGAIDPANPDLDLLSAAVFHETNKRREEKALALLSFDPKVREAAKMQAEIMAERGSISHVNPDMPEKRTPSDRLGLVGLKAAFSAENVATAFGLQYKEGEPVYRREENRETLFSRQPGGEPIGMHTYISFAKALLDDWMASPHHRENILSKAPRFLGASCVQKANELGMPMFFCAQVFFTPLAGALPPKGGTAL